MTPSDLRLPKPNKFGSFYFKVAGLAPAAIHHIATAKGMVGKYLLVLPGDGGIVWNPDNTFRPFDTPQLALVYLICHLAGKESRQQHRS